jgi:hypothetical protein
MTSMTVQGVYEAMKDIDGEIDMSRLTEEKQRKIVREGTASGWLKFKNSHIVLDTPQARMTFFALPYKHVLDHFVKDEIVQLKKLLASGKSLILLDNSTNMDMMDDSKDLSHAFLLKCYLEGNYPSETSTSQESLLNESIHL